MVNWKKWFLEEDEDEVYERSKKNNSKKTTKVVEDIEEDDFDIEFSNEQSTKKEVHPYEEDAEEINLEDFEYEDDFAKDEQPVRKKERKVASSNGFISKIKGLFSTGDKEDYSKEVDYEEDDSDEDEVEDYKTYLERQRRESAVRENDYAEEDEEVTKKGSFFSRLKDKFLATDEDEDENIDDLFDDMYEEGEIEEIEEVKETKKTKETSNKVAIQEDEEEIDFVELRRKNREKLSKKVEEEFEELEIDFEGFEDYDNLHDEEEIEKLDEINLEDFEEKEEKFEKTTDLTQTLKKLGVENVEIRDVDLFGDKSERRVHPTLAAVRTKRLKQDHKIEELGNDVVLGRDNKELKEEVAKNFKKEETPTQKEEVVKERKVIDEDFNKRTRREDKIEKDNPLFAKKDEKFENALDEIKEKGAKKYEKEVPEIEVKELEAEGERREKLKYTSVEDVLRGSDDLFEDDIDRVSKKLVGERFDEEQKATEEVEEFRKDLFADKKKEQKAPETALDELIEEEKIDITKKEETLPEIENLNTNLENLKKDKEPLVENEEDFEEEKPKIDRLAGYSDYHLDEDEIEELEELNYLDENTDNTSIDTLIREVSPNNKVLKRSNDIDKFVDEKMVPKEVAEQRVAKQQEVEDEYYDEHYDDYDYYEDDYEEERGIKYTEKLYTNDVGEYFDNGQGKKLGEYKIKDNGYRPVSKEKIENNQRILDEIFAKYSNTSVTAPKKSVTTTMMETNHITPRKNVGKFKPSPVYSSVYGSGVRKTPSPVPTSVSTPPIPTEEKKMGISQVGLSINREEPKKEETPKQTPQPAKKDTIAKKEVENPSSIYKEIAAQEETVWNIGSSKRVPKTKKGNKKK